MAHEQPCQDFKDHVKEDMTKDKRYEEKMARLSVCCDELDEIKSNQQQMFASQTTMNEAIIGLTHASNTILDRLSELSKNTMTKPQIENMLLKFSKNYISKDDIENIKISIADDVMTRIRTLSFKIVGVFIGAATVGVSFLGLLWFIAQKILEAG